MSDMKRREFLAYSALAAVGASALTQFKARAEGPKPLTAKDMLKEGQPTTIANYCENVKKQPNKFCPTMKPEQTCDTCNFYNKDNSETTIAGKKGARCQLLADVTKPQGVWAAGSCSTWVKKV